MIGADEIVLNRAILSRAQVGRAQSVCKRARQTQASLPNRTRTFSEILWEFTRVSARLERTGSEILARARALPRTLTAGVGPSRHWRRRASRLDWPWRRAAGRRRVGPSPAAIGRTSWLETSLPMGSSERI